MQRRKFLIGTGALAAGSAAAIGSGAFTAMQAGRDADINVVNDDEGLLALKPGDGADERVYLEDGELKIDFTSSQGGSGVNTNSRYQVGVFRGGYSLPDGELEVDHPAEKAFHIVNQDTTDHTVSVEYTPDDQALVDGAEIFFQFTPPSNWGQGNVHKTIVVDGDGDTAEQSFTTDEEMPPGKSYAVAFMVDTRGVSQDTSNVDLSGTLTVSAD